MRIKVSIGPFRGGRGPLRRLKESWRTHPIEWTIFFLLFITYSYFCQGGGYNSNSRLDLTRAIVEEQTFRIDHFAGNTADKALVGQHQYCDKAPGVSFLAVPGYAVAHLIGLALGRLFSADFVHIFSAYLAVIFSVSLISALAGVVFYRFALALSGDAEVAALVALGYGLGSIAFPWSTLFYGHQVTGSLLLIAFYLAFRLRHGDQEQRGSRLYLFGLGLVGGYAVLVEYSAAVTLTLLAVYLFLSLRRKVRILHFFAGGVPPALLLMLYNYASFGGPFSLSYESYITRGADSEFKGMQQGFMGLTYPRLDWFAEITIHPYRGLFYLCPFLILAALGAVYFPWRMRRYRLEWAVSILVVVFYFLYNSSYVYWDGGYSMGPRHVVPMIPFFCLFAVPIVQSMRGFSTSLAAVSTLFALAGTATYPESPYEFKNPLWELFLPNFFKGSFSLNRTNIFASNNVIGADYNSFNLGELMRLPGFLALMPLLIFLLLGLLHLLALLGRRDRVRRMVQLVFNGRVLIFAGLVAVLIIQVGLLQRMDRIERLTLIRSFQGKNGLIGRYYEGTNWVGEPKLVRLEGKIDYTWTNRDKTPVERPFSVEWEGHLQIETPGRYLFSTESDDGSFLWINDEMVVDNGGYHSARARSGEVDLQPGMQRIRVRYFDSGYDARIAVYWKAPGGKRELIPADVLVPDPAATGE